MCAVVNLEDIQRCVGPVCLRRFESDLQKTNLNGVRVQAHRMAVEQHRNAHLLNGLAVPTTRHTARLVTGILKVLRVDLRKEEQLSSPHEAQSDSEECCFIDDVRGGILDRAKVHHAHREEADWCKKMRVRESPEHR